MRTFYQAGPLFSEAEKAWHRALAARLREAGLNVVWPGDLLAAEDIEAAGPNAPALIFAACKKALDRCDAVLALLDGAQVDDGTAWEIGYAYARGLPVYGLRTDFRQSGETPHSMVNSMIQGCLTACARNVEEVLDLTRTAKGAAMETKVLEVLQQAGKPLRPGEIAKALWAEPKEVGKAIDALKKAGRITSPKRCFYGPA
jgi:nucleoside 2-deoxyribosyltransferase